MISTIEFVNGIQAKLKLSNEKTTVPRKLWKHLVHTMLSFVAPCWVVWQACACIQMPRCSTCPSASSVDLRLTNWLPMWNDTKWLSIYKENKRIWELLLHVPSKASSFDVPAAPALNRVKSIAPPVKHPEQSDRCQPCRWPTHPTLDRRQWWDGRILLHVSIPWSPPETCMSFISVSISSIHA